MSLHEQAGALLRSYRPAEPGQRPVREAMLAFLAARPDACQRSCRPGHLTASAVVLDHERRSVLLTLHGRLGVWLQVGGHCEPEDGSLLDAARREAVEETGLTDLQLDPVPISLDVHALTCSLGVPTRHLDVCFLAVAAPGARPAISAESADLAWWGLDGLPEPLGEGVVALVGRARRRVLDCAPA